jgi:antitoxin ParD1/3/4
MSGYVLHREALADLEDIWDFVAKDDVDAADRLIEEIRGGIRSLVAVPHKGHRRTDLTSKPYRFWTVRKYLIAYIPDTSPLPVLAVLHGRRSPKLIAAILRQRE